MMDGRGANDKRFVCKCATLLLAGRLANSLWVHLPLTPAKAGTDVLAP